MRLHRSLLVNIKWILRAVLTPMPLVNFATPNILHYQHPSILAFYYQILSQCQLKTFFKIAQLNLRTAYF